MSPYEKNVQKHSSVFLFVKPLVILKCQQVYVLVGIIRMHA